MPRRLPFLELLCAEVVVPLSDPVRSGPVLRPKTKDHSRWPSMSLLTFHRSVVYFSCTPLCYGITFITNPAPPTLETYFTCLCYVDHAPIDHCPTSLFSASCRTSTYLYGLYSCQHRTVSEDFSYLRNPQPVLPYSASHFTERCSFDHPQIVS